ncbi:alpha/beta hydrolase [Knoellia sp. p5-6-4]|uniref:alpha/beta hydrolase n=1 Tax=unclassified Knoellia TaxID=2618719 RepID=UPI0023DB14D0|nr:alpha/beta hydrolase [Knoellia sp. p5-6-4]MDF2144661.1 alpha/beta hydrolase [Knoellia sp. p5-6-4]
MTVKGRSLAAAATVLALALSGCTLFDDGGSDNAVSTPTVPQTPPTGAEDLAQYYGQKLSWSKCAGGQCAELTVPLSYDDPDGETIKVEVLRVPASRQKSRVGSLVVNPGGPGGSGVDYAQAADFIVGKPVRQRFDVVGFDPRGVDRSAPIDCLDDRQLDRFLGSDPTPDSAAEEQSFAENAESFAQACKANAGPLLGHVSTVDAAKDMDILRAALGDPKLNYLGKSYGTYLGATYADLFPESVGQFVLDGVVAPDLTSAEVNEGQAAGFELATRAWAEDCVSEGDCPLGGSVDEVMEGMRDFLKGLDENPIPSGDPQAPELTEGWGSLGIAAAMYDQGSWGILTDALRAAVDNRNGRDLMALANTYADRTDTGQYTGNIMEVIYAVNCLDKPDTDDLSVYQKQAQEFTASAPTWGPFLAWSSLPCGYWPVEGDGEPKKITAEGSGPIVVVGTTRDPATPYEWSVRLNDQLANSALITYDGDGHTAYTRSNSCVDGAIDNYYVKKQVPRDGLKC